MPFNTGVVLNNRYRIVKLLGQGGFGAVYRAWDISLNRPRVTDRFILPTGQYMVMNYIDLAHLELSFTTTGADRSPACP